NQNTANDDVTGDEFAPNELVNSVTGKSESPELREARDYLVDKSSLGPKSSKGQNDVEAIDRLHPDMATRLAAGLETLEKKGINITVNSAARAPEQGANPRFAPFSQHTPGVAVDLGHMPAKGTKDYDTVVQTMKDFGLYQPWSSRAEQNHFQLAETGQYAV